MLLFKFLISKQSKLFKHLFRNFACESLLIQCCGRHVGPANVPCGSVAKHLEYEGVPGLNKERMIFFLQSAQKGLLLVAKTHQDFVVHDVVLFFTLTKP